MEREIKEYRHFEELEKVAYNIFDGLNSALQACIARNILAVRGEQSDIITDTIELDPEGMTARLYAHVIFITHFIDNIKHWREPEYNQKHRLYVSALDVWVDDINIYAGSEFINYEADDGDDKVYKAVLDEAYDTFIYRQIGRFDHYKPWMLRP